LNKYIKCNFGGLWCGTSTIVDVRRLKVKSHPTLQPIITSEKAPYITTTSTGVLILLKEVMGVVKIIGNT